MPLRGIVGQLAVLPAGIPPHRSIAERYCQLRMRRVATHLLCCAKEAKRFPAAAGTKGEKRSGNLPLGNQSDYARRGPYRLRRCCVHELLAALQRL